jgi:hydroxyacylglutathione hydrolase
MDLRQFVLAGLGHISALLADDDRSVAAVVDPRRDVDVYLDAARERGYTISHVIETHLHNDYVSGARELAALTGAQHVHAAAAELAHPYRPIGDAESFDVGSLRFSALATPGHTPEHMSYSVADRSRADEPLLLFTGGSLLVGAVGRTDLLGAEHAEPYARLMYASLHERLLTHEDFVEVLPTHGGGSLCSKRIASTPHSTVGFERRHNGLVAIDEVEAFVKAILSDQPAYPTYFARMRAVNQAGPSPLGRIAEPVGLPPERVKAVLEGEALLVDLRAPASFAVAHIPGSISIPADASFGTWLGWVVPHDRPLVLLLEAAADWDAAIRQALRIGYEAVVGHLAGGFGAWQDAGLPTESSGGATVGQLRAFLEASASRNGHGPLVLDVRQRDEYARAHVPGSMHLMAGDLPVRLAELPRDRPLFTICASGFRSSIAASLLQRAGFRDVTWVSGGVPAWRAAGYPVERGLEAAGHPTERGLEAAGHPAERGLEAAG